MSSQRKPRTIDPNEIDPSVYYYDEVYDDMEQARNEQSESDDKPKHQGSKYIQGIIETAERRKSETEIRKFKKYTRDREEAQASGELDGTDVYVTKSYEKKLKEMREALNKHSEPGDDRILNSFKQTKHHKVEEKAAKYPSKRAPNAPQTSGRNSAKEYTETDSPPEMKTKVNRPKTMEERREFLREILAKRTVGEVFKAAQERYRQRKAKT